MKIISWNVRENNAPKKQSILKNKIRVEKQDKQCLFKKQNEKCITCINSPKWYGEDVIAQLEDWEDFQELWKLCGIP